MVIEEALDQMPAAGAIVMGIEYLKNSGMPWFSAHSDKLNRYAAVVAGLIAATGIHYATQGNWGWKTASDVSIHLPPAKDMLEGLEHVALQLISQEGMYRGYRLVSLFSNFLKRPELDDILKQLQVLLKSPEVAQALKQLASASAPGAPTTK